MDKSKQHLENAKRQLPKSRQQAAAQAKQTAQRTQKTDKDLKGKADGARQTADKAQKSVQEAKQTLIRTRQSVRQTTGAARKTIKTSGRAEKGIKQSAKTVKATGKNSVKAAKKGMKTAQQTAKATAKTETQERTVTDDEGNETTETVTITTLIIMLEHKSAEDMAAQYGFSEKQKEKMRDLLDPEYADLWAQLLGSYIFGNGEIGTPDGSRIPKDIFSWPTGEGFGITSNFGYRKDPYTDETKYHGGIDIGAPNGTPILAMADGTVIIANSTDSWGGGYGYHVKVQHDGGYATLYAHCSQIAVANGQEVKKGQVIAYVGTTG